jgi:hypothetical protein
VYERYRLLYAGRKQKERASRTGEAHDRSVEAAAADDVQIDRVGVFYFVPFRTLLIRS